MRKHRIGGMVLTCMLVFSCEKAYKVEINYCESLKKDTIWVRQIVHPKPYKRLHTNVSIFEANGKLYTDVCYLNILDKKP